MKDAKLLADDATIRETVVALYPPRPFMFIARQKGKKFVLEWRPHSIDGCQTNLSNFLNWARDWGVIYDILAVTTGRMVKRGILELQTRAGFHVRGEYSRGLFYHLRDGQRIGPIYREFRSLPYLVRHGLDGLPSLFHQAIPPDLQIFKIVLGQGQGVFSHSLESWRTWWTHLSHEPRQGLASLAISIKERPGDSVQKPLL